MNENEISYEIRGAIFEVFNELGPGLLESVYTQAMYIELVNKGLKVYKELALPVYYKNHKMDLGFRLDLLVEEKVIIELKSVETLLPVHHKQLLTYLKVTTLKLGILVNFNTDEISNSIFRKVNNL